MIPCQQVLRSGRRRKGGRWENQPFTLPKCERGRRPSTQTILVPKLQVFSVRFFPTYLPNYPIAIAGMSFQFFIFLAKLVKSAQKNNLVCLQLELCRSGRAVWRVEIISIIRWATGKMLAQNFRTDARVRLHKMIKLVKLAVRSVKNAVIAYSQS